MKTVWKHELPEVYGQPFPLKLLRGARILSVQLQRGKLVLWEIHEIESPTAYNVHNFIIIGTGSLIHVKDVLVFRGTVQLDGGGLILHVFEIGEL